MCLCVRLCHRKPPVCVKEVAGKEAERLDLVVVVFFFLIMKSSVKIPLGKHTHVTLCFSSFMAWL